MSKPKEHEAWDNWNLMWKQISEKVFAKPEVIELMEEAKKNPPLKLIKPEEKKDE